MTIKLRILVLIAMVLFILYIFRSVRKKKINYRFGILWLVIAVAVGAMAALPDFLTWVSQLLGIAAPVNMLFFLGFVLVVGIILELSASVSRLNDEVRDLTQRLALYEHDSVDGQSEESISGKIG
ncbi:MAG: DUF2304 domain-containing protein [Lachnospiraceae bacterium]|nr:DUF2304 domain-containing protein [Lachnospiraceae bacterium]